MAGKQVEFPPQQTHSKSFERGMWIFSIGCVIFVIIAVLTVGTSGL